MSETETTAATHSRRRPASQEVAGDTAGLESYEAALEKGYIGGPADDTDLSVSAERPAISERSVTHHDVPEKARELQAAYEARSE